MEQFTDILLALMPVVIIGAVVFMPIYFISRFHAKNISKNSLNNDKQGE